MATNQIDRWTGHSGRCNASDCPCIAGSAENDQPTDKMCICGHPFNFHSPAAPVESTARAGSVAPHTSGIQEKPDKGKGREPGALSLLY